MENNKQGAAMDDVAKEMAAKINAPDRTPTAGENDIHPLDRRASNRRGSKIQSWDTGMPLPGDDIRSAALEAENERLRDALADKVSASTLLTELNLAGNSLNITYEGGACQLLAETLGKQFRDMQGDNYIEMGFVCKDGLRLLVTLQRANGKTPAQLKTEAEAKVAELEARLATPAKVQGAATDDSIQIPRATLELIDAAMNHMGDVLNGVDAVEDGDEEKTLPAFEAVRALLAVPPIPAPIEATPTAEEYSDLIRELCCQLSVGGYNSDGLMPIATARAKINDGIEHLIAPLRAKSVATIEAPTEQTAIASAWIDVLEQRPPMGEQVLVFTTPNGYFALDQWDELREDPLGMGGPTIVTGEGWGDFEFEDITHWMPLPEAPAITAPVSPQSGAADTAGQS